MMYHDLFSMLFPLLRFVVLQYHLIGVIIDVVGPLMGSSINMYPLKRGDVNG